MSLLVTKNLCYCWGCQLRSNPDSYNSRYGVISAFR